MASPTASFDGATRLGSIGQESFWPSLLVSVNSVSAPCDWSFFSYIVDQLVAVVYSFFSIQLALIAIMDCVFVFIFCAF